MSFTLSLERKSLSLSVTNISIEKILFFSTTLLFSYLDGAISGFGVYRFPGVCAHHGLAPPQSLQHPQDPAGGPTAPPWPYNDLHLSSNCSQYIFFFSWLSNWYTSMHENMQASIPATETPKRALRQSESAPCTASQWGVPSNRTPGSPFDWGAP